MRTGATLPLDRFQQAYRAGISRNLRTENGPFLHPLVQRRSVYSMFLGGTKCLGAPGSGAGFNSRFGPHVFTPSIKVLILYGHPDRSTRRTKPYPPHPLPTYRAISLPKSYTYTLFEASLYFRDARPQLSVRL